MDGQKCPIPRSNETPSIASETTVASISVGRSLNASCVPTLCSKDTLFTRMCDHSLKQKRPSEFANWDAPTFTTLFFGDCRTEPVYKQQAYMALIDKCVPAYPGFKRVGSQKSTIPYYSAGTGYINTTLYASMDCSGPSNSTLVHQVQNDLYHVCEFQTNLAYPIAYLYNYRPPVPPRPLSMLEICLIVAGCLFAFAFVRAFIVRQHLPTFDESRGDIEIPTVSNGATEEALPAYQAPK
ncbi:UNVERIFIED_CONTAM: hypothetical protein HDU68_003543 [Siphonaria sp. JEL0065]|nr:hypothetical protein HDU68_003543 [Siphonaria sp. JEL0065]